MHPRRSAVLATAFFSMAILGCAQNESPPATKPGLKVGDPAPALAPGKWIKGEPVTAFAPGTVYVVEFWATWCGPCRKSIPHLSELQARFKDRGVIIIGQNSSENDPKTAQDFVDKMGDKMNYRVALDDTSQDRNGRMNTTWMDAAGQQGIPTAFVVDGQGRIAWIGHPMDRLDQVLERVLAGNFDPAQEAGKANSRRQVQEALHQALNEGDVDKALTLADELAAIDPDVAPQVAMLKFQILLEKKDYANAYQYGAQALEAMWGDADGLNEIAWVIATGTGIEQRDLALAEKAALRARELSNGKDGAVLDTLARIYFEQGKLDQAIATQTEALAQATDQDRTLIEESLTKYKAARDNQAPTEAPTNTP